MKRIFYLLTSALLSFGSYAQVRVPFAFETTPGFGNSTVKFNKDIFAGDYGSNTDLVDILAISGDCTVYDRITDKFSPMKGNISNIFPILSGSGSFETDSNVTVFASLEKNEKNVVLGDGGGLIMFKINRSPGNGGWKVVPLDVAGDKYIYFQNVNYRLVGGTVNNNGFIYTGTNAGTTTRFLATEDASQIRSNKDLVGFSDTADYKYPANVTQEVRNASVIPANKSVKKYLSLGWPVEVDGISGEVIGRVHRFGRGAVHIVRSGSSYYFAYPGNPSVLMKYSPYSFDLSSNSQFDFPDADSGPRASLFAYKEDANGNGEFSIPIAFKIDSIVSPIDPTEKVPDITQVFDSLIIAKDVALRAGATMFANIGDIAVTTDILEQEVILITEKGVDDSGDWYNNPAKKYNGVLAKHLQNLVTGGNLKDPFGRVLAIQGNSSIKKLSVVTEGGATSGDKFFSNPDKIELIYGPNAVTDNNDLVITIKENIPATDKGRNPVAVPFSERTNEAYYLQISSDGLIAGNTFLNSDNTGVVPIPFSEYTLYESGSKGSMLSSSAHSDSPNAGNTILSNSKASKGMKLDTYLSVVNGYNGTDKSMIIALRGVLQGQVGLEDEIGDKGSKNFAVWPNPTTGVCEVKDATDYTVTDVSGNLVKTFTGTTKLDLSDLQKGMYFLKKGTNGAVKKIILN